jgi:hypothetical protein
MCKRLQADAHSMKSLRFLAQVRARRDPALPRCAASVSEYVSARSARAGPAALWAACTSAHLCTFRRG